MSNIPTLRERLNQLVEYHLPKATRHGDHANTGKHEVIGYLDGTLPEVIVNTSKNEGIDHLPQAFVEFDAFSVRNYDYGPGLSMACGGVIPPEEFESGELLHKNKIELRAVYDPATDLTHYFVLPSLAAITKACREQR